MAYRRRRRFKGTWLPNLGSIDNDTAESAGRILGLTVPAGGGPVAGIVPLLFDSPTEPALFPNDTNLGDFVGNEYVIRRIVGKCFVEFFDAYIGGEPEGFTTAVEVTAGLFVARAGDDNDGSGQDLPIGGLASIIGNYRPDGLNTIREPWIWRRQWILGNPGLQLHGIHTADSVTPETVSAWQWPSSNVKYGSVLDGPHVDAKTRRRIGNDERLWWVVEARNYPFGRVTTDSAAVVRAKLDYRVFGALRRARNSGNF